MRKSDKPIRQTVWIILALVILLGILLMAAPAQSAPQFTAAAGSTQQLVTPTATVIDPSEVGSTNGIVIIGFAIVGIVIVPVLLHWKDFTAQGK